LYGRAFESTDGPGKPFSGVGEGSWENGCWDYKALPLPGSVEHLDMAAGASYCQDECKRKIVSYDTVPMARRKTEWLKEKGLGGAMWWESSADGQGEKSLIGNVVECLGGRHCLDHQANCICYPQTKYENLRAGFPNN